MAESKPEIAPSFKPYIPDDAVIPELTVRALLMGSLFGLIFGGVTVYVGLRAGLTVSASIPIAVLSISLLRVFPRVPILNMIFGKKPATILENNLVQTTGSAGESVAGGVLFTLPALIFLGFDLDYWRILVLALIGGWLGVLFMIPLRRQLIVKEHGALPIRRELPAPTSSWQETRGAPSRAGSSTVWASVASTPSFRTRFVFKVLNATPT